MATKHQDLSQLLTSYILGATGTLPVKRCSKHDNPKSANKTKINEGIKSKDVLRKGSFCYRTR
jgi:hypothetical protein